MKMLMIVLNSTEDGKKALDGNDTARGNREIVLHDLALIDHDDNGAICLTG